MFPIGPMIAFGCAQVGDVSDPRSIGMLDVELALQSIGRDHRWLATGVSVYSQAKLDAVARRLSERPRQTLNFETPAERFQQCVAMTD